MSGKSEKSAGLNKPFAARVLAKVREIAEGYQIIVHCEEGHWYGRGLEMPQVFGDGKSVERCMENTHKMLTGAAALMLERGERPPARPGWANARNK